MYGLLIAQMAVIIGANIFLFFIIPSTHGKCADPFVDAHENEALMPFERHHHKSTVENRMMKMLFSFQVIEAMTFCNTVSGQPNDCLEGPEHNYPNISIVELPTSDDTRARM